MKNAKKRKQSNRSRRNRRVRERIQIGGILQKNLGITPAKLAGQYDRVREKLFGIAGWIYLRVIYKILWPRLEKSLIRFGKWNRKSMWPRFLRDMTRLGRNSRRMVREENRVALAQILSRVTDRKTPMDAHCCLSWRKLRVILSFFNPQTVYVASPSRFKARFRGITFCFALWGTAMVALLAVILWQLMSHPSDDVQTSRIIAEMNGDAIGETKNADGGDALGDSKREGPNAIDADFYNPFFIFTQAEAKHVEAYPLADPPGLVVDLHGISEPPQSPAQMVGDDVRVLKVRRLKTSKGLRYIIRLSQSIKRIKSQSNGNVVTVSPLS
ncbi:MAG: hypothetical protein JXR76_22740 [Deltaproteobacteria bacterium]|nr:hypothetical protein [Deltaproteobacteria bacterium]